MTKDEAIDVEAERPLFEREMNAQRFFPAELDFTRGRSPSGRDEYVNSHLQSNWNGWLAAKRSIQAERRTPVSREVAETDWSKQESHFVTVPNEIPAQGIDHAKLAEGADDACGAAYDARYIGGDRGAGYLMFKRGWQARGQQAGGAEE